MAQHIICRSLSSGRGGGKSCQGAAFHTRWGGAAAPPKAMLDPGLVGNDLNMLKTFSNEDVCSISVQRSAVSLIAAVRNVTVTACMFSLW